MNVFQLTYYDRLRSWRQLRDYVSTQSLQDACVQIDAWWQLAPLRKYHLHPQDIQNWPDPWTMLSENTYCELTRAIGMCYTLLLTHKCDIQLVTATDAQCEQHTLVLVDYAKYILNWWPNTVLSITLHDFTIQQLLSIDTLKTKIKL